MGLLKFMNSMSQSLAIRWRKLILLLNDYIVNNELKLNQIFNLLFQILTIMADVHSRGIYHRDLSPSNIFLCDGLIKISDFGLAKDSTVNHSHLTMNTNNYGQFYYCVPEQITGLKNATKMSDVYSLERWLIFV